MRSTAADCRMLPMWFVKSNRILTPIVCPLGKLLSMLFINTVYTVVKLLKTSRLKPPFTVLEGGDIYVTALIGS